MGYLSFAPTSVKTRQCAEVKVVLEMLIFEETRLKKNLVRKRSLGHFGSFKEYENL